MVDTTKFDIAVKLTEAQIEQISWSEVKKTMKKGSSHASCLTSTMTPNHALFTNTRKMTRKGRG